MFTLLIAFLCGAIAELYEGFGIFSRNSRFGGINSRLGLHKFPFRRLREFGCKPLISLAGFGKNGCSLGTIGEFPGTTGKTGKAAAPSASSSDREVLGLRVVDDDGGSGLLGIELVFFGEGDADLLGAQER
jgi:hypothetical protein